MDFWSALTAIFRISEGSCEKMAVLGAALPPDVRKGLALPSESHPPFSLLPVRSRATRGF